MPMSPRLLRPRDNFTPRSISGLALWLDAADSSTLYTTDAGPVTAVSSPTEISGCALWLDGADSSAASMTLNGSLVETWKDKSGNGRNATASGTARPTLTGLGLNGRSVITFDGTSTQMQIDSTFLVTSNATILAVARRTSGSFGAVITSKGTGDTSPALQHANGSWQIAHATNISVVGLQAGYAVISGTISAGATSAYANGLLADSDASVGTLASDATKTYIGTYRAAVANVLAGEIAEIVVYPTALSATDRARVEAYLAAKWGISGVHAAATSANDPVGYWRDRSGNGRHATQATGANRPVVGTLGSKAAAAFAGANSVTVPAYPAKATSTYVYVSRHDDGADTVFQTGATNQFHSHLVEGTSKFRRRESSTNGVVLGSNIGVGLPSIWCVDYSSAAVAVRYNGATIGSTQSPSTDGAISDSSLTTTLGRLSPTETYASLNGRIGEFMVYGGRNLSDNEKARLERYLAAKWGITLAPQVSNADAQDWVNRVYANGGTVSATTASAVNTFCNAIDTAGIRDRFYRLNLFCGNSDASLNAVRTPLFRGQSLTGTQYGNAIDTNVNFVAGDYSESVGLNANGTAGNSSKYIDTGLSPDAMPTLATGHASVFKGAGSVGAVTIGLIGSRTATQFYYIRQIATTDVLSANWGHGAFIAGTTARTGAGLAMFTRTAANAMSGYFNTTSDLSDTTTRTPTANANAFVVFGFRNTDGTLASLLAWPYVISAYSIGAGMTAAQVASYHTALTALLAALGRATT